MTPMELPPVDVTVTVLAAGEPPTSDDMNQSPRVSGVVNTDIT
jgi:hypothetical protein